MDGTLIDGRSIIIFSEKLGFKDKLLSSWKGNKQPYEKSIEIAKLLKGFDSRQLLDIFRNIPMHKNVENIANKLVKTDIKTAVVTDSYQFIADDLKKRLNFDFAYANKLIIEKNIVTGEVIINNNDLRKCDGSIIYSICKDLILDELCDMLDIQPDEVIAVGDGMVDIGMLKKAGLGIAFNSSVEVQEHADIITDDLAVLFDYI